MLYGFAMAAIAGFMLTAIPNWTGRMPLQGLPLLALVLLWSAGRIALYFSEATGSMAAAALYAAVILAALTRIAAAFLPEPGMALLMASGVLWGAGYLGFTFVYGRYLICPRPGRT